MSHQNRLAHETSPYLQQHADNPVDWYPWCAEALDRARREDKPILLSIGYSACHWCHVMAHESFEDPETAGLMNRLFVNIKVDREERPDLDKIYQLAQQVLTQRTGGWPLTMFLTPADHMPFFGGTYFPREPRHGLPPFREVLTRIADAYRERRTDIEEQNASVAEVLARAYGPQASTEPSAIALRNFVSQCAQIFDAKHGGFGRAPKFPHTPQLERLLRYWARNPEDSQARQALDMLRFTLAKMSSGGIFDHLAGGFCRYSVDDYWMIPHFEKMLYDNGPLLALYAEASVALDDAAFRNAAHATARWMMREMQAAEGGYFSSLDADSEGVEGKFYVWTPDEVRALLTQEEYVLFARRFGLDRAANFEGEWHLHAYESLRTVSEESGLDEARVASLLESGRRKLLSVREQRVHPSRDEKILTSWNALAIRGMAVAAQRLSNPEYLDSAERALTFIHGALWKEGHLLATYKDGKAHLAAYLDDYAFLIDAILEFLQARWDSGWLDFAQKLADVLLEQFEDRSSGGFLFTGEQHESLIQRPRSFSDESMPAGNAIAARALMRLGWLVGETRFIDAADRTIKAGAYAAGESPLAHCALLSAIDEQINPPATVIVRGETPDLRKWQTRLNQQYRPGMIAYSIPNDAAGLPAALAEKKSAACTVAYLCKGLLCTAPVESEEALAIALEKL